MIRRIRGIVLLAVIATVAVIPGTGLAQQAVTITGHVSAGLLPIRGATVKIEELELTSTTNAEGRFSFIVPSTRVRGQTVLLSASYLRYRKQSIEIALVGGSLVRDFDLNSAENPEPAPVAAPGGRAVQTPTVVKRTVPATPAPQPAAPQSVPALPAPDQPAAVIEQERVLVAPHVAIDTASLRDLPGFVTLASALTGKLPGVDVQSSSAVGGTTSMIVRGQRSIAGLTQPLLVVNGTIVDNSNLANTLQRSGQGGLDYGTTIADFKLEDVASVELLDGPAAAMRYGGRAANGVLLVRSKDARNVNGVQITASQQISNGSVIRLPSYQNRYGQGLGGKFSFFDGKGGGVNDTTTQSWGPPLNGSPVTQASFTEAGRPDVRAFNAQPDNVKNYFRSAHTSATNVALQSGNAIGHLRVSLHNQIDDGITPNSSITRRSVWATGDVVATPRLSLTGDLQLHTDRGEDRPGSGFDESNPVAEFARLPRQIDVETYRTHLRDAKAAALSWNYSGRNNPYFASEENDTHDTRTRVIGGSTASYDLPGRLLATARIGIDHSSENRAFSVATGWMGGFPYYLGRGDFSTGGFQNDDIARTASNFDVGVRTAPALRGPAAISFSAGASRRNDDLKMDVLGADRLVGPAGTPLTWEGTLGTNALFAGADAHVRDAATLSVSARGESTSLPGGGSAASFYPSILGTVDLMRLDTLRRAGRIESVIVHGGWSRSGNEVTPAFLERLGFGLGTNIGSLPQLPAPELTSSFEVGVNARMLAGRVSLDATAYDERSSHLVVPDGSLLRTGKIGNRGVTAGVVLAPLSPEVGIDWTVRANITHNANTVQALSGLSTLALGPSLNDLSIVARVGSPLGTLLGMRFLRDASGALVLRGGRPLADSAAGPVVLGQSEPTWFGGFGTSVRRGYFELDVNVDARHGGKVFSASNRAGAYAGVLDETSFRPDTGLLIAGIDIATLAPNTTHVSTEDYYHALGAIAERWVYDASYVKLREARLSVSIPFSRVPALQGQSIRLAIIGRNLALWTSAPNIDPETVLSSSTFRGAELGQLPSVKTVGFQVTLTP